MRFIRVDPRLVERMEMASVEELLRLLENGTNDEKRQAALELGYREEQRAFDRLIRLLNHPKTSIQDGAALGLSDIGDRRAIPTILAAIRARRLQNWDSGALLWALIELDPRPAIWELEVFLEQGNYVEAEHASRGLRSVWDDLAASEQEAIRDKFRQWLQTVDMAEMEEWREEWIDEILTVGGWSPEERALYEG